MSSELLELFFVEANEHLETLETGLLPLQGGQADSDHLDALFRAAHSVKGGAGAVKLHPVVKLTHALEALLDDLRTGQRAPDGDLVATLLEATDRLKELLTLAEDGDTEAPSWLGGAISALDRCRASGGGSAQVGEHAWRIEIEPATDILLCCNDPLPVLELLAGLGELRMTTELDRLPPLSELEPYDVHLRFTAELHKAPGLEVVQETIALLKDEAVLSITPIEVEKAPERVERAESAKRSKKKGSIRVDTTRIDELLEQIGELVMAQAVVAERSAEAATTDTALNQSLKELERRMRALQDGVLSMRMRPISDLFERVPRLVFELCRTLGKDAQVVMDGEWTEVDREVLEKLSDPMVHLVRNALDHGLESPDQRLASGKSPKGTLRLSASHTGGDVVILIEDDGAGVDPQRVRARAVERGLIPADARLEDDRLVELIFSPGFSTASQVTDLSGRGVGMDVVRRNIEALGGRVSARSRLGRGTTFEIVLPLTLAIIDGQLLEAGGERFVIPVRSMVECLRPEARLLRDSPGVGRNYPLRGKHLRVLDLAKRFGLTPQRKASLMVVVEAAGRRLALEVDELSTQRQFVLKSIDKNHRAISGLSGATVLTDGSLAMVLDVGALVLGSPDDVNRGPVEEDLDEDLDEDTFDKPPASLVTLVCGGQSYAVDTNRVLEIRGWSPVSFLPFSPPTMLGAMPVSGEVVPVLDGRRVFGHDAPEPDARSVVVFLRGPRRGNAHQVIGVLVDSVLEVTDLDPALVQEDGSTALIQGLIATDESVVSLVDLDCLETAT